MISTRIRLVALDLDGTLVGPGLAISERVRAAIAQARARGTEITIVTGRMFAATKPFAQTLGIAGPLVCYQGAAIFEASTGTVLRETPVRQEVTRMVLAWAEAHGVHAHATPETSFSCSRSTAFPNDIRIWRRSTDGRSVVAPKRLPIRPRSRSCWSTIRVLGQHLAALKTLLGERAYLTRSHA